MAGSSIINYKGKDIIYANHQGLNEQALLENIKLAIKIAKEYPKPEVSFLGNFTDTFASKEVMDYIKSPEVIEVNKKYKKMAVFGITGLKKIMLNAFNSIAGDKTKVFNTEEEAKEYLVK